MTETTARRATDQVIHAWNMGGETYESGAFIASYQPVFLQFAIIAAPQPPFESGMMRTILIAQLLFLTLLGCTGEGDAPPPVDPRNAAIPVQPVPDIASWVNRVWIRSDDDRLPGQMRIFLADGTLVMDSCWETFRLSRWEAVSDSSVVWTEDNAEIEATLTTPVADELEVRLELVGDTVTERYRAATVPYVCPDMPR